MNLLLRFSTENDTYVVDLPPRTVGLKHLDLARVVDTRLSVQAFHDNVHGIQERNIYVSTEESLARKSNQFADRSIIIVAVPTGFLNQFYELVYVSDNKKFQYSINHEKVLNWWTQNNFITEVKEKENET